MKKFMAIMAVFVMAAGMAVAATASDVPASVQSLELENYAGHVDLWQISEPIETGAVSETPSRTDIGIDQVRPAPLDGP